MSNKRKGTLLKGKMGRRKGKRREERKRRRGDRGEAKRPGDSEGPALPPTREGRVMCWRRLGRSSAPWQTLQFVLLGTPSLPSIDSKGRSPVLSPTARPFTSVWKHDGGGNRKEKDNGNKDKNKTEIGKELKWKRRRKTVKYGTVDVKGNNKIMAE